MKPLLLDEPAGHPPALTNSFNVVAMTRKAAYPKRPVRVAMLMSIALSLFVGACLLFMEPEARVPWPGAIAYCAFLSFCSIGLARFGRKGLLLIGLPFAVAFLPAIVGVVLLFRSQSGLDGVGWSWLRLSLFLIYASGAWAVFWVLRGWLLCFRKPSEPR